VSVAALAAGTYRELADRLHFAGYIFVGIIVVFLLLVYLSKKVIERAERKHLHSDEELPGVTPRSVPPTEDMED
jgi:hypothetical protein